MLQNPELHYLDNAATTIVAPEVADVINKAMREHWANPSSLYAPGARSEEALNAARAAVARTLGCKSRELYFTSCGSEGDNWAIRGAVELGRRKGKHIITTAIEHSAVLEPCRALEREGYEVTYLAPNADGQVSMEDVKAALRPDTMLVSMMLVNNELGTLQPVAETAKAIRGAGSPALLHCDAVQGFLKVPFTPKALGVDLLTISGHKIHAPKGVGALYIRKGLRFPPLIRGGGQEEGLRSGTEATAQIAAFAAAAQAGKSTLAADLEHMAALKADLARRLPQEVPGAKVVLQGQAPHILPITLPGYKSEVIVRFLSDRGICVSSGSACHKGKPSHVYAALKLPKKELDGVLRISFSYDTTPQDIDALLEGLKAAQEQLFTSLS